MPFTKILFGFVCCQLGQEWGSQDDVILWNIKGINQGSIVTWLAFISPNTPGPLWNDNRMSYPRGAATVGTSPPGFALGRSHWGGIGRPSDMAIAQWRCLPAGVIRPKFVIAFFLLFFFHLNNVFLSEHF
jgi:hypothetical protein